MSLSIRWKVKVILTVKPTGTIDQGRIKAFRMIGCCQYHNPGVGGESIEFVKET